MGYLHTVLMYLDGWMGCDARSGDGGGCRVLGCAITDALPVSAVFLFDLLLSGLVSVLYFVYFSKFLV